VLHFQPRRYDRWEQNLEVTVGELIPGEQVGTPEKGNRNLDPIAAK
jgi:hypothetical protein